MKCEVCHQTECVCPNLEVAKAFWDSLYQKEDCANPKWDKFRKHFANLYKEARGA